MEDDTVLSKLEKSLTKDFVAPGLHLLIDFWGCRNMQDETGIGETLRRAAEAAGAMVLDIQLHTFGEKSGVTGVALLAESHISIHTWPEIDYVALDVFVCGTCNAYKSLDVLAEFFAPQRQQVSVHERGVLDASAKALTA